MADFNQIRREIETGLRKIENPTKLMLALATQQRSDSLQRIFTDGIQTDGGTIGTYKPATIRIKKKQGRFTSSKINLRDTEQLVNAYAIEVVGKKKSLVGFTELRREGSNAAIVDDLEDQFGVIFAPTEQELLRQDLIIDQFTENLF